MNWFSSLRQRINSSEDPLVTADIDDDMEFTELYQRCRPFTMTSKERMFALYQSVRYISAKGIEGSFVECGVWRGGSIMLMAETLRRLGDPNRKFYLYDTFQGMTEPSDADVQFDGIHASVRALEFEQGQWCNSSLEDVQNKLIQFQLADDQFNFVEGRVEETIPGVIPDRIALLRLDTDWYESTKHELEFLYPKLEMGGVMIIDDYGHWKGCQKAVDEFFINKGPVLLNRIDYSGRLLIKS